MNDLSLTDAGITLSSGKPHCKEMQQLSYCIIRALFHAWLEE